MNVVNKISKKEFLGMALDWGCQDYNERQRRIKILKDTINDFDFSLDEMSFIAKRTWGCLDCF